MLFIFIIKWSNCKSPGINKVFLIVINKRDGVLLPGVGAAREGGGEQVVSIDGTSVELQVSLTSLTQVNR